ncbi:MAG: T9SS type A sorting domain-containing protein [Bacteroidetes bacterium]|nr:T9SS type A sorting domain-containing protein [Bacteroidota bacterium]
MKYINKFLLLITLMPGILLLIANSSGSPGGRTGSPGDGNQTCTACHSGTAISQSGWISTNIPPEGYTPGATYEVVLNAQHASSSKFGFELTAETAQAQKTGVFSVVQSNRTKLLNQGKAVTHTSGGTAATGGTTSWVMNWTAPASAQGEITFYAAVNASNSNNGTSGDVIYKTSFSVQPMAPAALTAVQPNTAAQGQTVTLTITGTNTGWTGTSPTVQLTLASNPNQTINAQAVTVNSSTQLQAEFNIPLTAAAGTYHLKVNNLQLDNAFTITAVTTLAETNSNRFEVFPNPASGQQVRITHAMNQPKVQITDLNGRLVASEQLFTGKQDINIGGLKPGLYYIVLNDGQHAAVQKLVIR